VRNSLYWDDFSRRVKETVTCLKQNKPIPIRRVAVFITNKCNFRCGYCNLSFNTKTLSKDILEQVIKKYNKAIIHITGGEPSIVRWLYPFIEKNKGVRFHLNTNAFVSPPNNIKRLKISLDSHKKDYYNHLVGVSAFDRVVKHIKMFSKKVVTSVTCVLTKETYKDTPELMKFCRKEFPSLYAVFFTAYKGTDKKILLSTKDVDYFFKIIKPKLEKQMNRESLSLFRETLDEKRRLLRGIRFPENKLSTPCYLSMSEKVVDWNGNRFCCSHLFRDNIFYNRPQKHKKCKFGCNRRLVKFNEEVEKEIK